MIEITPTVQVAQERQMSAELRQLWQGAITSIKQAQKKFLGAYKATLESMCPDWEQTWQNDPSFVRVLADIEDQMRDVCKENGMQLTTFNRYRWAARRSLLVGVDFKFASANFTIPELVAIKEGGEQAAKEMRKEKNLKRALTMLENVGTVMPIAPASDEHPDDFLANVKKQLSSHLNKVRQVCGEKAARQLLAELLTA